MRISPNRFRHYRRLALDALWVAGIIAAVVGAVTLLNLAPIGASGTARLADVASVVQLLATSVIITAGAVFAYRKLQLFRDFEPHLTVTHDLSHRPIGQLYVHVAVTAALHNSSKVRVEIREAFFELRQIAPMDDGDVELYYSQSIGDRDTDDVSFMQWPLLDTLPRATETTVLTIEPSETHYETGEFIISRDVQTVLLYSYFFNSEYFEHSRSAPGWTATTVYDIVTDQSSTNS